MNRIVLIFVIVGIFSCTEKKQVKNSETKQVDKQNEQVTRIEFDTEMHDFGRVKSGETLVYSFVFVNRGETVFVINKAEADCGCIEADLPKEPIPPGEKGIIEVKFNSTGMIGRQLKTVEIQSNSKEPKHLIIFAEVENEQIEFKY